MNRGLSVAALAKSRNITPVEEEILLIKDRLTALEEDTAYNRNAISALSSLLGVTLNADGTLASQTYTAHTHGFLDSTVNADGVAYSITKTTWGVS